MDQERMQELAALKAAGALDGEDAVELDRALEQCSFLHQELRAFNEVAAALASGARRVAPPAELKQKILRRIQSEPRASDPFPEIERLLPARSGGFSFVESAAEGGWRALPVPGAFFKLLSIDRERGFAVALGKLEAGAHYPAHRHHAAEDIFMLSGDLRIGESVLRAGDYHHAGAGTNHPINSSENGCSLLIVLSTEDLAAQLAR